MKPYFRTDRPKPSLAKVGNAKPVTINPEIMVLASLKIQHSESGSDLSFAEWLKSPKKINSEP